MYVRACTRRGLEKGSSMRDLTCLPSPALPSENLHRIPRARARPLFFLRRAGKVIGRPLSRTRFLLSFDLAPSLFPPDKLGVH